MAKKSEVSELIKLKKENQALKMIVAKFEKMTILYKRLLECEKQEGILIDHACKVLGVNKNQMLKFLRDHQILMEHNAPYEKFTRFFTVRYNIEHILGFKNPMPFKVYVTPKGLGILTKIADEYLRPKEAKTDEEIQNMQKELLKEGHIFVTA